MAKYGACDELRRWPYKISRYRTKPTKTAYSEGLKNQVLVYERVRQRESDIKLQLSKGNLVVFGFSVYSSIDSLHTETTGYIDMPSNDDEFYGGHAIVLVGYNDDTGYFMLRNSWGEGWGEKGYGYLPYEYVLHPELAADFWVITRTE